MELILIRHTRLSSAAAGVCCGRSEMPLAETFAAEAEQVRAALPWRPEVIWTSPARRCGALAEVLHEATARTDPEQTIALKSDPRLTELNFGAWEGCRWDDLKGPEVERWFQDPWRARPPGGETAEELVERVRAFRSELLATEGVRRVAVVTHAGVIRAWRSLAEGIPLAEAFAQPVAHGCVMIFNR